MVVALGPGRFYGSSLPRPRFFSDVKFSDERVDPPTSVLDPLLSWANEAHWSMGGLSIQRHRLQGRIEGSVKKLRAQQDSSRKKKKAAASAASAAAAASVASAAQTRVSGVKPISLKALDSESSESEDDSAEVVAVTPSPSPPPLPKKKRARKLMDEFEVAAAEEGKKRRNVVVEDVVSVSPKKDVNEKPVNAVSFRTRRRGSPVRRKEAVNDGVVVRRTSPRKSMA